MTDVDHSSMTASEMGMSEDEHKEHLGINQSKKEKLLEIKSMRNKLISLVPIVIISIFVMSWDIFAQFSMVSEMSFFGVNFFIIFANISYLYFICCRSAIFIWFI